VPIRVTLDSELRIVAAFLTEESSSELARAVAAQVKKLMALAVREVAADGHEGEARLHPPTITWSGPGLAALSDAERAVATARLSRAILAAAQAALPAPRRGQPLSTSGSVTFDQGIKFRVTPRRFFALLGALDTEGDDREERYLDILDQPADGIAFQIRTSGMMFLDEVRRLISDALDRRFADRYYYYALVWHPVSLAKVIDLDPAALRAPLASAHVTRPTAMQGMIYIGSARLVLVVLLLPHLERRTATVPNVAEFYVVKLRELDPIIDEDAFFKATRATWASYRTEWGYDDITVDLFPFMVHTATHGLSLRALYAAEVAGEGRGRFQLGGLLLLTRNAVKGCPSLPLDEMSNQATLALPDTHVDGVWQPGWAGVYLSAWFDGSDFQVAAARHRPEARVVAGKIIALLTDPPHHVEFRIWDRIIEVYGRGQGWTLGEKSEAFGFLLEQLDQTAPRGTWLARFYQAAEAQGELWELAVRLAHGTPYQDHPVVVRARDRRNERRASGRDHMYFPGAGARIDGHWNLRPGQVLADGNFMYSAVKKQHRLKKSAMAKMGQWMLDGAKAVVKRCIDESREMSKEEFSRAVLEEVQKKITADDVEEVEVQRSLRLIDVIGQDDRGIKRYFVKFNWVERVEGERTWEDVKDERGQVIVKEYEDGQFEELLFMWSYARSSVVVIAFGKGVTYAAMFVIAWQVGVFELVPHALGFIAFNTLIYLGKAARGGDFTIEGLALEAVKGFAMALGFQIFAPVGRFAGAWVAEKIGAASVARVIAGYLLERLTAGVIAGAPTGALVQLATDMASIAMGTQQGFSDWRRYFAAMGEGAVMGIFLELGGDALRVFGKTATAKALAEAIRKANWTPAKWWAAIDFAQANLRRWLVEVAGEVRALRFAELWDALVFEARGLKSLVLDEARAGIMRRIIRFSDLKLTGLGERGLQKLLTAIDPKLAEGLVRALSGDAARGARFLETLGALDESLVAILANRSQLEALLGAPRVLELLANRAAVATRILETFTHQVAAVEAALVELEKLPAPARDFGLLILARRGTPPPIDLLLRALRHPGLAHPGLGELLIRVQATGLRPSAALDDLLTALAALDEHALGAFLRSVDLAQLARSPAVLALLRRDSLVARRLLGDVFGNAAADLEVYLARFAKTPPGQLDNAAAILLRAGNALPRDLVADAVLRLGRLEGTALAGLDRVHTASRVPGAVEGFVRADSPARVRELIEFVAKQSKQSDDYINAAFRLYEKGGASPQAASLSAKVIANPDIPGLERWLKLASRQREHLEKLRDLELSLVDAIRQRRFDPSTNIEVYVKGGAEVPSGTPGAVNIDVVTSTMRREWKRVNVAISTRDQLLGQVKSARLKFKDAGYVRGADGKQNIAIVDLGRQLKAGGLSETDALREIAAFVRRDDIIKQSVDELLVLINGVEHRFVP
jgi:hypothetical protein